MGILGIPGTRKVVIGVIRRNKETAQQVIEPSCLCVLVIEVGRVGSIREGDGRRRPLLRKLGRSAGGSEANLGTSRVATSPRYHFRPFLALRPPGRLGPAPLVPPGLVPLDVDLEVETAPAAGEFLRALALGLGDCFPNDFLAHSRSSLEGLSS